MNVDALRRVGWKIVYAKYLRGKAVIFVESEKMEFKASGKPGQTVEDLICHVEELALEEGTKSASSMPTRDSDLPNSPRCNPDR